MAEPSGERQVFFAGDDVEGQTQEVKAIEGKCELKFSSLETSLEADHQHQAIIDEQVYSSIMMLKHVDSDLNLDDDDDGEATTLPPSRSSSQEPRTSHQGQGSLTSSMPTTTAAAATHTPNTLSHRHILGFFHHESFVFALRISVAVTIASLFVVAFPLDNRWPQASWIYVTTCIVAWQPQIDTASVLKKTIQRTFGTMLGALLGMAFGFVSLEFSTTTGQAVYMAVIVALHGFLYPFACDKLGFRNNYAAFLGCFTFGIVLFAFYDQSHADQPWVAGIYRVLNILIGCLIVALTAVLVVPISTKDMLVKAIQKHIKAAGESSQMVLERTAAACSGEIKPLSLADMFSTHSMDDDVHSAYVKNIDNWKACRDLFPTLKYDPCFLRLSEQDKTRFRHHMLVRLARSFRIQMNAVMLDAMTRTEIGYEGPKESLDLLRDVGEKAKLILDLAVDQSKRDAATKDLLEKDLVSLRFRLARMTEATVHASKVDVKSLQHMLSHPSSGLPLSPVDTKGEQSILLFSLVEHLILRIARLHYYCLEFDEAPPSCSCFSIRN